MCIVKLCYGDLEMKQLPQLRFRITEEEDNARKYLNSCGYNVNTLIRNFIMQLYEKELAKQNA